MEIPILYEDDTTLVINKPVDVVVNRAESIKGETVQDWVERREWFAGTRSRISDARSQIEKTFLDRSGVCHRLDKETSGCLVIAKTPEALGYYLGLFKNRKIIKTYVALVHGKVEPNEGEVILPLKRSLYDREKWQVHYEGKRAVTAWKVVERFVYPGHEHWKDALTLVRVNLKTGRTHQIRVHLSFLGWPIFSDFKYLNRKFSKDDRRFLYHHFLHAAQISFKTSLGKEIVVDAPLPEDCQRFLDGLQVLK